MKERIKTEKALIRAARLISGLFSPYYIATVSFLILFLFTYLAMMPFAYKLTVMCVTYSFTMLIPTFTVFVFRKINGFSHDDLTQREQRYIPFFIYFMSYVFCLFMMRKLNIPWYMMSIILTALLLIVLCLLINIGWRLSEHAAGSGAVIGGIIAFSTIFGYNPVWWLCLFIMISGIVGSACVILQRHSLGEVFAGFVIGLVCSTVVINPFYNDFFRFFLF